VYKEKFEDTKSKDRHYKGDPQYTTKKTLEREQCEHHSKPRVHSGSLEGNEVTALLFQNQSSKY
jgi:hypothetical protein